MVRSLVAAPTKAQRELAAPEQPTLQLAFSLESLPDVRAAAAAVAEHEGLSSASRQDLVLAVDELATNSVVHGGGGGELALWSTGEGICCEVSDRGHIANQPVERRPPDPAQLGGRGLWVVAQLCESVEIYSSPGRTLVRARLAHG